MLCKVVFVLWCFVWFCALNLIDLRLVQDFYFVAWELGLEVKGYIAYNLFYGLVKTREWKLQW